MEDREVMNLHGNILSVIEAGGLFVPDGLRLIPIRTGGSFGYVLYDTHKDEFLVTPPDTPLKASDRTVTIGYEGKTTVLQIAVTSDSPSGGDGSGCAIVMVCAIIAVIIVVVGVIILLKGKKE